MMEKVINYAVAHWTDALEIAILSALVYAAYLYLRGTRGTRIFMGVVVVLIALQLVSQLLDLRVIGFLLGSLSVFVALALVIIFQPELRRVVADIAAHPLFASPARRIEIIDDVAETVIELANRQIGALLAIENGTQLRVFADSGVPIDAQFTKELMLTIFFPRTALHDGGVILREDRVVAAACIFPVSQEEQLDRTLGLRHRAALGLSEETDAVVLVVSEETGGITICHHNQLERNLKPAKLRKRLAALLLNEDDEETASE